MSGHGAWSGQGARPQRTQGSGGDSGFDAIKRVMGGYGVNVSDDLRDVKYTSDATDGMKFMMDSFPMLRGQIETLKYDADYPAMAYSQSRFGPDGYLRNTLALTNTFNSDSYHSLDTLDSLRATGAHEAAHALADAMRNAAVREAVGPDASRHDVIGKMVDNIHGHKVENSIIRSAAARVNRESGTKTPLRDLRRGISLYAMTNMAETFAEAMGDYSARGERAHPLSVAIFHETRRRLGLE